MNEQGTEKSWAKSNSGLDFSRSHFEGDNKDFRKRLGENDGIDLLKFENYVPVINLPFRLNDYFTQNIAEKNENQASITSINNKV